MSIEIGMDPMDDSWDWQQKKDKERKWKQADRPNGAPVSAELIETPAKADVIPDVTKKQFFEAARAYGKLKKRPDHIGFEEATQLILRGLRVALTIQPATYIDNYTSDEFFEGLESFKAPKFHQVREKKFMTLVDVHSASRSLLAV